MPKLLLTCASQRNPENAKPMSFVVESKDPHSRARSGTLQTAHGAIQTPIFMPVGTQGSVKAVPQDVLANEINPDIILGNTYHPRF